MGTQPRRRQMGRGKARDRQTRAQRARCPAPESRPTRREEGVKGKEQGTAGAGCACKAGENCAAVHPDARSGRCSTEGGVHMRVGARQAALASGCACPSERPDARHADY
jgi:hypothetical protein